MVAAGSEEGGGAGVVVITGASAGVGRATARAFARRGARIGLLARGRAGLEAARREVEALGGRARIRRVDVADAAAVDAAADAVEEAFGPIDVWINNAMASVFSPVRDMEAEEFRRVTEVTYLGTVHGTLVALRRMLPRHRGRIIQVGSALAYRGIPLQAAYCAAKHAIQGFTESLRAELYHDGSAVSVCMVQMPALNTPQFDWVKSRLPEKAQPVPPIFQPEVAADAIVWAAGNDRPEVYVGGSSVKSILGNRIAPRLLDHYVAHRAWETQQTGEPEDPHRPHNLWAPLDDAEDRGARGGFDEKARRSSAQLWSSKHRGWLAAGAAVAAGVVGATLMSGSGGDEEGP